jgi:hypothetical protein
MISPGSRFSSWLLSICMALAILLFSPARASAQLPVTGDAYTERGLFGLRNTNFGSNPNLLVTDLNGLYRNTYIQFSLSPLPAGLTSSNVSVATLKFFVNTVARGGTFDVYLVTSPWAEGTITGKTDPTQGAIVASAVPVTTSMVNDYVLVDVTSAVQAWLSGTPNNGLALVATNGKLLAISFSVDSKESTTTSHAPEIDVVVVSAGPQGPAGAPGTPGSRGPAGAPGTPGSAGAQGPAGAPGTPGPQGPPVAFQGTWSNTANYGVGSSVFYNGSSYISLVASNLGNQPDTNPTQWAFLAQQGSAGAAGPQGSPGPIGLTGAPGLQGRAGAAGATGPQGPIGLTGATGSPGPVGLTGATGPQGPIGLTGAQGPQGVPGTTGPAGPAGAAGPQGPPVSFQGPWSSATTYGVGDAVFFNGSSYISLVASNLGNQPDQSTTQWTLLAQQGATGAAGAAGPAGPIGSQGPVGAMGATGATGATGPQGPIGLTGPMGPQGPAGSLSGTGTPNYLPLFGTGGTSVANSLVFQDPTTGNLGIGTAAPKATLDVNGTVNAATAFNLNGSTFAWGKFQNVSVGTGAFPLANGSAGWVFQNTAIGENALSANVAGGNTALGYDALIATNDANAGGNTALGSYSMLSNTTGFANTAVGEQTLQSNTTGFNNTALGIDADASGSAGYVYNATAIGAYAYVGESNAIVLGGITNVNNCIARYYCASINVGIGTTTPQFPLDVNGIIRSSTGGFKFPDGSVQITAASGGGGGGGTITGVTAGTGLSGGGTGGIVTLNLAANPCAAGQALSALPFTCSPFATLGANSFTGNQNVTGNISSNGIISGTTLSGGTVSANSYSLNGSATPFLYAIGTGLGDSEYLGFAGQSANKSFPGDDDTAVGFQALNVNGAGSTGGFVAFGNTAIGAQAMFDNTLGIYSTASGYQALYKNTTGNYNTGSGYEALYSNSTGTNNTATGNSALYFTTGSYNTGDGAGALQNNSIGNYNTALGYNAGPDPNSANLTNATAIGANAIVSGDNSLVLGGTGSYAVSVGIGTPTPQSTLDVHGNVSITGSLSKGSGSFKIDHPLDPANKYLYHSFVESPDMMDIYNGVATLDAHGMLWVTLPDYFQALNREFRYQLTSIGRPQPTIYIAEEISGNRFKIAGGKPGGKVSWQVTGIRQDAFANAHRIPVEEDKPQQEQGHYLHPELFGATAEQAVGYHASALATHAAKHD